MINVSKYNVFIDKKRAIVNLLSGSIIRLDFEKYISFKKGDISLFNEREITTLLKMGFICEHDELEYILKRHKTLNDDIVPLTIMTTSKCNANCFYCFEKKITREDINEKTINSITKYLLNNRNKTFYFNWYGGEPLLNIKPIKEITSFCEDNGIKYLSRMITNGYFIDKYINFYNQWKIDNFQITLDGVDDNYEAIKSYNPISRGSFNRVINNVDLLLKKGFKVSIRLNFNLENIESIKYTITYLNKRFNNKNLKVYIHHIFGEYNEEELSDAYLKLYKHLNSNGFIDKLKDLHIRPINQYCSVTNRNFLTIFPNGDLYKCECTVGDENHIVGNINDNSCITSSLKYWESDKYPYKSCLRCKLLPICQGGCKYIGLSSKPCTHIKKIYMILISDFLNKY